VLNINFDVLHAQLQKDKFNRAKEKLNLKYNKC